MVFALMCLLMREWWDYLPPKGLTLPFLSYGGSSVIVLSILFSLIISLEKKDRNSKFIIPFSNFFQNSLA